MPGDADARPSGAGSADAGGGAGSFPFCVSHDGTPAWPLPINIDLRAIADADKPGAVEPLLCARPGVAVLSGDGPSDDSSITPVLISACGDLRSFVAGRLRGEDGRADLSAVVTRVDACEAGSGFEADLACAALQRVLMPESAALAASRRAPVFVHLDPDDAAPSCRVVDAARADSIASSKEMTKGRSTLIGPFSRKSHAEAWAAMLETRFDLCREPATLALHPGATACPYKAMGACPAPCDGSEPMETYRARCREALAFDGAAWAGELSRIDAMITDASAAMDFERAASLKEDRELLGRVDARSAGFVGTMDRFAAVGVMPSGRRGWARLFVHAAGATRVLGDVGTACDPAVVRSMIERAIANSAGPDGDGLWIDAAALVLGRIRTTRKLRGVVLPVSDVLADDDGPGSGRSLHEGFVRAIKRAAGVETDPAPEPGG